MAPRTRQNIANVRKVSMRYKKLKSTEHKGRTKDDGMPVPLKSRQLKDGIGTASFSSPATDSGVTVSSSQSKHKLSYKSPFKLYQQPLTPAKLPSPSVGLELSVSSDNGRPTHSGRFKASNVRVSTAKTSVPKRAHGKKKDNIRHGEKTSSCERTDLGETASLSLQIKEQEETVKGFQKSHDSLNTVIIASHCGTPSSCDLGKQPSGRPQVMTASVETSENSSITKTKEDETTTSENMRSSSILTSPLESVRAVTKEKIVTKRNKLSLMKKRPSMKNLSTVGDEDDDLCSSKPFQLRSELAIEGKAGGILVTGNDYQGDTSKEINSSPAEEKKDIHLPVRAKFPNDKIALVNGNEATPKPLNPVKKNIAKDSEKRKARVLHTCPVGPSRRKREELPVPLTNKTNVTLDSVTKGERSYNKKWFKGNGCSRTEGCPQPLLRRRDMDDFVLESSFRQYRTSNKKRKK